MFVSVKYGLDAEKENYVNANCSCSVLMDSLKERVVSDITKGLAKRREEEKKVIARLSRQRHVCVRQLQKLKHVKGGGDGEGEGGGSGDEGSNAAVDEPAGDAADDLAAKIMKTEGWISGCEAEIKEREDLINSIIAQEENVLKIDSVDLADPSDQTLLNMYGFGPEVKATAVLPLRCTVNLMGYPKVPEGEQEEGAEKPPPFSLLMEFPKINRTPEVEEMIATLGGGPPKK